MRESAIASVASTNVLGVVVQHYHANYLEISTTIKLVVNFLPSLAKTMAPLSKSVQISRAPESPKPSQLGSKTLKLLKPL
jgi:hypothetical protein